MGFSTSGAVIVILIGALLAVSVLVPTLFSVSASTGDAFSAQGEQIRDQSNADVTVVAFENGDTDGEPNASVTIENTGSSSLSITDTDLVVNGEYYAINGSDAETTVNDNDATDVWTTGAKLNVELHDDAFDGEIGGEYDRVRITTEHGIADSAKIGEVNG